MGRKKGEKKLTIKQRKFTKEYLETGNATESAIRAGYSKKTAYAIGSENLTKPIIKQTIEEAQEKLGISPEYVLTNFKEMVEFGKKKTLKSKQVGQEMVNYEDLQDGQLAFKANEALAKNLQLFTEKVEITGKDGKDLLPEQKRKDLAKKLAFLFSSLKKD
jgi:phage terminase small subunit